MSKGFGIHGSTTSHGGTVLSTQSRSSQMGNLFLRAGDGFACPKCKVWSTLIKSNDHVIFDGKAVAYVGDKFTCGATLMPKQVHVVGDSGGSSSKASSSNIANNFISGTKNNWINYKFNDGFNYEGMPCTLYFKSGASLQATVNENNILEFKGFSEDDFDYLHFTDLKDIKSETAFSDELLKKI